MRGMMQDSQVVDSVLAGDVQAFELLVLKYQKPLFFVAKGIIKNSAIAEEIVQDALVRAYEKLDTLKNHAGFFSWIKRIVINMGLNQFDRSKWDVDVSQEEYDFFDSIPVMETPEQNALKDELQRYVRMFIDSLPDKLRLVLVMREMEDLSYEEISEMLDVPVGTVRSRLFNARKMLKDRLIKQGLADGMYDVGS